MQAHEAHALFVDANSGSKWLLPLMDFLGRHLLKCDAFQCILNTLLLHPSIWNRREHFGNCSACDRDSPPHSACECCRSRHPHCNLATALQASEGCAICLQAWVLTTVCKDMMRSVQMHNATCSCLTCAKSWMDRGWHCPHNPWYMYTMPWMQRSLQAYLATGRPLVDDPFDLDWMESEEDEEVDDQESQETDEEEVPVAARVRATSMHGMRCMGEGSGKLGSESSSGAGVGGGAAASGPKPGPAPAWALARGHAWALARGQARALACSRVL